MYCYPCSVFVGLFELRSLYWIFLWCEVCNLILAMLCIIFPILWNICCVDLLYFLILCWGVMKIWTVWFSDCSITSHALFFFSSKTCWGWWIIVWIWAFFFLLAGLRSLDRGNWFGPPKSNLPFWDQINIVHLSQLFLFQCGTTNYSPTAELG